MDYADLREAVYNHLCTNVPAVSNRVFWSYTAPKNTERPYLVMYFTGELPSINTYCGVWMQFDVLCFGEEANILSLDPIADLVVSSLHKTDITTPLGRTIRPEYNRDSRVDYWDEDSRSNVIRLKFWIPTDLW